MSNLVRIEDVRLYLAYTDGVVEGMKILKALKEAQTPYILMSYGDDDVGQKATLEALSTWDFGEKEKRVLPDFPVVTWYELYDDFTKVNRIAQSLTEFQGSEVAAKRVEIRPFVEPEVETP